jgi:hypothetical protein
MPRPLQFLLNGSDISASVREAVIERQEKRGADSCKFLVPKSISVGVNDDLKVREVSGGTYVFGGRVVEVSKEYDVSHCVALSYGKVFDELRVVPPIVYVNSSPEGIVNDLRSRFFPDFSLSSATSGVTIDRYEATGTISENLRILADLAGFDFWTEVDALGNKVLYFRPANVNLGRTLYLGKVGATGPNALRVSYELDDSQLFNVAEVYGRSRFEEIYYRWDYTGSGVGAIILPLPITSIRLAVRGVNLVEGVNFIYRPEQRALYFYDSTTNTYYNIVGSEADPTSIEISGLIDKTPAAYAENGASISAYGRRVATVIIDKMYRDVDVSNFAQRFVQIYGNPRLTLTVKKPGLDFGIRNGGYVRVYDPYLGINGSNFVVRVVRWKYPEGVTELVLSQFEPELYDFQRGIAFKVETATRSYAQAKDRSLVEKRLYLSGSGATFRLSESFGNIVSGYASPAILDNDMWVRMRLDVIGSTTNSFYSDWSKVSATSGNMPARPYYLSILAVNTTYPNASNQVTLRAQFSAKSSSVAPTVFAPTTSSSNFFTLTLSNVRMVEWSYVGAVMYFSYNSVSGGWVMWWGPNTPTYLFGLAIRTV